MGETKNQSARFRSGRLRETLRFLAVFAPCVTLIVGVLIAACSFEHGRRAAAIASADVNHVDMLRRDISDDFSAVVSDLLILAEGEPLQYLLNDGGSSRESLEHQFLSMARNKGMYDQVRYLDETGMEIVRVNYAEGTASTVPEDGLQFKGDRYYFRDTVGLSRGEIFVSPFDLNIELGVVEEPIKPTIRFGTPVFDRAGNQRGAVILNFYGALLLERLEQGAPDAVGQIMLLNSDGYWLAGAGSESLWGFMYPDRVESTFSQAFPEAWERIRDTESGQFNTSQGMFTFSTVHPLLEAWSPSTGAGRAHEASAAAIEGSQYVWKLVLHVPQNILAAQTSDLRGMLTLLGITLVLLAALGSALTVRVRYKRRQAELQTRMARDAAEAANRAKSEFLASMSHELRTPLNAIIGFSDVLEEQYFGELNEKQAEYVRDIQESGRHLLSLINDVLDLAKVEAGGMDLEVTQVDLSDLVESSAVMVRERTAKHGIELLLAVEESVRVEADERRIRQVLYNLLSNAAKFTPDGGKITVEVKLDGEQVRVCVQDTGIGIDPTDQVRVFDEFYQAARDLGEKTPGTGLGLPLSRQLVEMHGGKLWLESEGKGRGSRFCFTLPASAGQENEKRASDGPAATVAGGEE